VELMGSPEQIAHAEQLVKDVIAEVQLWPICMLLFLCMLSDCFVTT
jgi:hypothetical protein